MRGAPVKSTFVFILMLMTGIVLGALIGELCAMVPTLSFMNYGKTFGIPSTNPLILDLWVVKMVLGLEFRMTVSVILGLFASIFAYKKLL